MSNLIEHLTEVRRILKSTGFRAAGDTITDAVARIAELEAENAKLRKQLTDWAGKTSV